MYSDRQYIKSMVMVCTLFYGFVCEEGVEDVLAVLGHLALGEGGQGSGRVGGVGTAEEFRPFAYKGTA